MTNRPQNLTTVCNELAAQHAAKTTKETAAQAHARLAAEALRRLKLITGAVRKEATQSKGADWGDVGSLAAVVEALGQAGHYAQVPELTEK